MDFNHLLFIYSVIKKKLGQSNQGGKITLKVEKMKNIINTTKVVQEFVLLRKYLEAKQKQVIYLHKLTPIGGIQI